MLLTIYYDETCFHIACILLHYGHMGDTSRDLNTGETIANIFQTPKLQKSKLVMGLAFMPFIYKYFPINLKNKNYNIFQSQLLLTTLA